MYIYATRVEKNVISIPIKVVYKVSMNGPYYWRHFKLYNDDSLKLISNINMIK